MKVLLRVSKRINLNNVKSVLKYKLIDKDSEIESKVLTQKKKERKMLLGDELDNKIKLTVSFL